MVGLKSPVIITRAFGCLDRINSMYICVLKVNYIYDAILYVGNKCYFIYFVLGIGISV